VFSASAILREEYRLKVFENRALTRIFGLKRDEMTGSWRGLHNAELLNLHSLPGIVGVTKTRRLRWAGLVTRMDRSLMYLCD
jgi:hypothetical protein